MKIQRIQGGQVHRVAASDGTYVKKNVPHYPDWFGFNEETLEWAKTCPAKLRPKVLDAMAKVEWDKCHDSLLYWLDRKQHIKTEKWPDGLPYVYTYDPHQAFRCGLCLGANKKRTFTFDKLDTHLEMSHNIRTEGYAETLTYFEELPSVRPFPYDTLPYIKPIAERWLKERYLFIMKSRDMVATWTIITFYAWDTLFNEGAQNIVQSLNAKKAHDLVDRAWRIYKNQPKLLREVRPAKMTMGNMKGGELTVPSSNSIMMGFPQDPDQIRQFHPRGLYQDEAAFLPSAAASFAAAKPSIQNGGRFTATSSANPGWFEAACMDWLSDYGKERREK